MEMETRKYIIEKVRNHVYKLIDESGVSQTGSLSEVLSSIRAYENEANYYEDPQGTELELSGVDELDFSHEG